MSNENRTDNSTDLVVKVIPPREPSVEYLREMIDDADKKFTEWSNADTTPKDINNQYFWIRQQLTDLIVVNNMLKKKEKQ